MLTVLLIERIDSVRRGDERRLSREADADFLSVYHLIGPINRPETFHHTIKASFELHCGI